jgi:hypothetical protein
MTMHVCIQLLALEHCWSIATQNLVNHPAYSSDFALSSYDLFTYCLLSENIKNNEKLLDYVKILLTSQTTSAAGIQKLIF